MPDAKKYRIAHEVKEVAKEIVAAHHAHLLSADIVYLFTEKPEKKDKREIWGKAEIKSDKDAFWIRSALGLDDADGVFIEGKQTLLVTINYPAWRFYLSDRQKRALIDHELCHFTVEIDEKTGEEKFGMVGHDVEEFNAILERHGAWEYGIKAAMDALAKGPQLTFEEIAGVPEGAQMPMPPIPETGGKKKSSRQEADDLATEITAHVVNIAGRAARRKDGA